MLYALILAGVVFLYVTFWHFLVERVKMSFGDNNLELESPVTRQGIDIYIVVFIALLVGLTISNIISKLYPDFFSLRIYLTFLLGMTFLILLLGVIVDLFKKLKTVRIPSKRMIRWLMIRWLRMIRWLKKVFFVSMLVPLIVGVTMSALFILFLHKYPFLADPEDASMDFVMKKNQCVHNNCVFSKGKDIPPKIVLLNIDDETHDKWGTPLFTPRHHIKELIDFSVKDGARLIVVDISLSQPSIFDKGSDPNDYQEKKQERQPESASDRQLSSFSFDSCKKMEEDQSQVKSQDQILRNYLACYKTVHCGNDKCPPIILVRDFWPPMVKDGGDRQEGSYFDVHKLPVERVRQSFMEDAVKLSYPYIQWASPFYWSSKFDSKLRRFWLVKPSCEDGKQKFIPSIELLVASLISKNNLDKTALEEIKNMGQAIDPNFEGKPCSVYPYEPKPLPAPLKLSEKVIIGEKDSLITEGGINQRIMFFIPWEESRYNWQDSPQNLHTQQSSQSPKKDVDKSCNSAALTRPVFGVKKDNTSSTKILSVFSAYRYLELRKNCGDQEGFPGDAKKELDGSIVIIGNTHIDAGDIHQTPLGDMPGMLVIVNAIDSLFLNGGLIETFTWGKLFLEALIIIMLGVMFMGAISTVTRVWYWLVMLLVTGGIWAWFTLKSSIILWEDGIWVDFSLPLVAVFFHHVIEKFHELRVEKFQERREATIKVKEARKEVDEARKEVDKANNKVEEANKEVDKVKKQLQTCQKELQLRKPERDVATPV